MDDLSFDGPMSRRRPRGDAAARRWALARTWAMGLTLAVVCQCVMAQAMYWIKPLGYLGGCTSTAPSAAGLNRSDEVAGTACNANGDTHAFLWKNNGHPMVDLGPPKVGNYSQAFALNASGVVTGSAEDSTGFFAFVSSGNGAPMTRIPNGLGGATVTAYAINDLGQVTGNADTGDGTSHAFLWNNDGTPMLDLGIIHNGYGFDYANGYAINASGQVAGTSGTSTAPVSEAFVWRNDGTPMLGLGGQSGACCINASGQVAGGISVSGSSHPHAFVWRNDGTGMHDLGTLPGGDLSAAIAQNDSGQVVGGSWTGYFKKESAFAWMNDGKPMRNLGTFGGSNSQSNDINASGQVTGWANLAGDAASHAFLWRNDGTTTQDLNALIDPTDPLKPYVTLTNGAFINDFGDVVAEGTDSRSGLSDLYLLQGTVLTLAPRTLAFGNHAINTTSAAKSVTVTNTSPKSVAIASITLTGTAAGQFAFTNNCGKSLAGHATCAIKVTFKPITKGAKSETLNVNGGGGGLRSVRLTGTGQ